MKKIGFLVIILLVIFVSGTAMAELLHSEEKRITDEAIAADLKTMDWLQERLAELNRKGVPIASYQFAKAQAWIDFARDEYTENDRSVVCEEALKQSVGIIAQLEAEKKDISMSTPIIPTSSVVRKDLWELAERLKLHPGFHCGEDRVAQFEVQLVWSGHEESEFGWRHSKPYLQAAERLAREAVDLINACVKPPVPAPAPACQGCPSCQVCLPPVAVLPLQLPAAELTGTKQLGASSGAERANTPVIALPDAIHFALDRADIGIFSVPVLQQIVAALHEYPQLKIELGGHTDIRGTTDYNKDLSARRAASINNYLLAAGIDSSRISIRSYGKSRPKSPQKGIRDYAQNRRVELNYTGIDNLQVYQQENDLQLEKSGH